MTERAYTIRAVQGPKPWTGKYGEMHSYKLNLDGENEQVELNQKPETPAPVVGNELVGTIEPGNFGPKFKKAQQQNLGRVDYTSKVPRPHPESARIERMAAHKVAGQIVSAYLRIGKVSPQDAFDTLTHFADRLIDDLPNGSGERAQSPAEEEEKAPPARPSPDRVTSIRKGLSFLGLSLDQVKLKMVQLGVNFDPQASIEDGYKALTAEQAEQLYAWLRALATQTEAA